MTVDLRPYLTDSWPNRGQIVDSPSDPNHGNYNCTIECIANTEYDLFKDWPWTDDQYRQDIINLYGDLGLLWPQDMTILRDKLPKLAALATITPAGNEAATIRNALDQGFICHIALWCDTNAWVPPQGQISYSHCCRAVADTGTGIWFQNPEPHPDFFLTYAQVNQLADGQGVLVFQKSVLPPPPVIPPKHNQENDMEAVISSDDATATSPKYVSDCYDSADGTVATWFTVVAIDKDADVTFMVWDQNGVWRGAKEATVLAGAVGQHGPVTWSFTGRMLLPGLVGPYTAAFAVTSGKVQITKRIQWN